MFSNQQLTSSDVDEVAYLRYALRAASYSAEHARLENCIADVQQDVHATLAEHADGLIDQARCTYRAQREVAAVRQSTDSLQKASGRLRAMIEEPYVQLQSRVRELEATQEAMQLLQSSLRFLSLTARLQEQLAPAPNFDVVRASYTLTELEEVLQDGAIRSLQLVEAQLPTVERLAATIRSKAHELLAMTELTALPSAGGSSAGGPAAAQSAAAATTTRVATQVSTGLQCAYVLHMLSRTVQGCMTERRREVLRTIVRELDAEAIEEHISSEHDRLSRSASAGPGGAVSEQAVTAHVVLLHIQKTLYVAVQHTQCVLLLWRVLLQRRDVHTQEPYLSSIDSPVQLLVEYWSAITDKLRERLGSLQKRHAIRLAMASAYPRYHHLVASFLSRTEAAGMVEATVGGATSSVGAAGGPAGGTGAALLTSSIHVSQCGMGDYLDLIDVVDAAVQRGRAAVADEAALATRSQRHMDTQDLRHTWLAQVSDEVRDAFRVHVLDRHREAISGVVSRLAGIVPPSVAAAGQPAAVAPVRMQGSRRPPPPPQVVALDVSGYTRLVAQEVHAFRQDPHTLDVLLDCVLTSLRQVRAKFTDAVRRYPLPPLPAVTAAPTLAQVMHLCIANACTALAYDCATVLAMVPHPAIQWTAGDGAAATTAGAAAVPPGHASSGSARWHAPSEDPFAQVLERLSEKRMELQQLIQAFHAIGEGSTRPFADSALALLLPTVTQVTDSVLRNELGAASAAAAPGGGGVRGGTGMAPGGSGGGDSRAALGQLQSQCRQFTERFFFLVDARTSGWAEACQRVTDATLAGLLTRLATTPPPPALRGMPLATAPAYARTLQVMMPPLLQLVQMIQWAGSLRRTTSLLRGCVRQVEGFYEACSGLSSGDGSAAAAAAALQAAAAERLRPPVPAFLAKLLVVQYGLLAAPPAVEAPLRVAEKDLLERVEEVLLGDSVAEAGSGDLKTGSDGSAARRRDVEAAVEAQFHELVAATQGVCATHLQGLWASIQS
ncbi:Golgi transport complex subunit 5 [Novymonas esmeraldas]|uniref:Conserved oligomeric Golgi complex subunit 5 n=1 Tax=Novymonas esmeraldas TaxID=1808958 RepID=A0AAW0EPZ9_9TRYP